MKIDFHTHNFPDALAPRAIASMLQKLEGRLPPVGDGTLGRQLADMDRFGVDKAVVCPVVTRPAQFRHVMDRAKAVMAGEFGEEAATRLIQLGGVHPADPDYAAHLKEISAAGIKGIKVHPYYQDIALDDPAVVPYFKAVRDAGLFVISHCGCDLGFVDARMTCGPNEIATLLKRVPGLTFVAAHLGGTCKNPPHATDVLLEYPNCHFDTAVLNVDEKDEEARRIMSTWPAERLLFATDYFWRDESHLIKWVERYRPDPTDREKIFHLNAERILGL